MLLAGIYMVDIYDVNRYERLMFLWLLCLIWVIVILLDQLMRNGRRGPELIPKLLREPYFPVLKDICP